MVNRLVAVLVLVWGLVVAGGGVDVRVAVSSKIETWSGRGVVAGLVFGLLLVGVAGGCGMRQGAGRARRTRWERSVWEEWKI